MDKKTTTFVISLIAICGYLTYSLYELRKHSVFFDPVRADNTCHEDALLFKDALEVKGRLENNKYPARILYVEREATVGHAVTVFYADGCWRVYDRSGTFPMIEYSDRNIMPTPNQVAAKLSPNITKSLWMN